MERQAEEPALCCGWVNNDRERDPTHSETQWRVRAGPNYKKNKKKCLSAPPLYDMVCLDAFHTDRKVRCSS